MEIHRWGIPVKQWLAMLRSLCPKQFQVLIRKTHTAFKMRIPDRWLEYSKTGEKMPGLPFICFKTPLSEHYGIKFSRVYGLQKDEEFTPVQLCENLKKKGFRLGMVIDLTNTYRYYNGVKELEDNHGIKYLKLKFDPYNPESFTEIFQKFNEAVKRHMDSEHKDALIGVHCTHGLNRTGYMVCRYMIEEFDYTADNAVKAFNEARGHNIEKNLDELQKIYEERLARKNGLVSLDEETEEKVEPVQDTSQENVRKVRYESRNNKLVGWDKILEDDVTEVRNVSRRNDAISKGNSPRLWKGRRQAHVNEHESRDYSHNRGRYQPYRYRRHQEAPNCFARGTEREDDQRSRNRYEDRRYFAKDDYHYERKSKSNCDPRSKEGNSTSKRE